MRGFVFVKSHNKRAQGWVELETYPDWAPGSNQTAPAHFPGFFCTLDQPRPQRRDFEAGWELLAAAGGGYSRRGCLTYVYMALRLEVVVLTAHGGAGLTSELQLDEISV